MPNHLNLYPPKIAVILIMIVICSCDSKKAHVKNVVATMMSQQMKMPLDKMQCRYHLKDTVVTDDLTADFKFVVFVDSSECSPCFIDGLYQWNNFIDEIGRVNDKVKFVFIVSPKKEQMEDVYLSISYCGIKQHIYVDTAYAFIDENRYLAKERDLQIFLLDKNNDVLLVGNPKTNDGIMSLLKRTISVN